MSLRTFARLFVPAACGLICAAAAAAQTVTPVLLSISPDTAAIGAGFTLAAAGSNFLTGAYISFNGQALPTTVYNGNQAVATVSPLQVAVPGMVFVAVVNPGGVLSNYLRFTIAQSTLSISTASLPSGAVGVPYSAALNASGGNGGYMWTAVSGLPPGLVLSGATITGTPTTAGTYSVTVRVTDGQSAATASFTVSVTPPPISITNNAALPAATAGQPYTTALSVAGGTAPYNWTSAQLPQGLRLDASQGILSGTLPNAGTFRFTVQVTDKQGLSATKDFSLAVNAPALAITTVAPLFAATTGTPYVQTFSAAGGVPPYTWSVVGGSTGAFTLNSATGALQGTAQNTGTLSFTIQVKDTAGTTASQAFSITVNAPVLTITTAAALPAGGVDVPYSARFAAAGGTPPYTWSVLAGSIAGLTLDSAGTLSGTPKSSGTFSITIQARDSQGITASRTFNIVVAAPVLKLASPQQLTDATVGTAFSFAMAVAGGAAPYTWSANGLPDGLSIDTATGVISGMPAAAGSFTFTVRVSDAGRNSAVDLFRITVALPQAPGISIGSLPAVAEPAQQLALRITMERTFPVAINGQAILTFAPDTGAGDSTILFSGGGRSADFTIPAGETEPALTLPLTFQTGTVAGAITASLRLQAAGVDITPAQAPSVSTRIERAAPVIRSVRMNRTSDGFEIEITGFCTAREVAEAKFRFKASPDRTLQASELTLPVDSLFGSWFQDPASARYGSQFTAVLPFKVQGDAAAVSLESVTLTNRFGSANSGLTQ